MILAIFGVLFGILGIFTIGIIFVPLAAICATFALVSGIVNGRFTTVLLAFSGGVLTVAGWSMSPSLWVLTAALLAGSR